MSYNIRLCTVTKRNDFEGYGFNLHSEAHKPGQFIGHVETDSPAFHAGLLRGDILVEVNGFNVCDENHQQVVNRIKENPSLVTLLVIDSEGFSNCKKNNIEITKDMGKPMENKSPNETVQKTEEKAPEVKIATLEDAQDNNTNHQAAADISHHQSQNSDSNISELSINEIKAKAAESGAKKRRDRNNPNTFKDRANLFDQL